MNIRSIPSSKHMRAVSAAFATALALAFSPSAVAADAAQEVETASVHAGLAAGASDIDGVHMHLHHVVNCLVGPDGEGFDADQMNPCQDQGDGAIPDTTDDAEKQALEDALKTAQGGLDSDDLAAAQQAATDTHEMLKKQEAK